MILFELMADRQGFEPWRQSPAYTLSRRAPSTTRPPIRWDRLTRVLGDMQDLSWGFLHRLSKIYKTQILEWQNWYEKRFINVYNQSNTLQINTSIYTL